MTSSRSEAIDLPVPSILSQFEESDPSQLRRAAAYCSAVAATRPAVWGLVAPKGGEGVRTVVNLLADSIAADFRSDVFVIDSIGKSKSRHFAPPVTPEDHFNRGGAAHDRVRIPSVLECADFVSQLRNAAGVGLIALPPVLTDSSALRVAPYIDGFILVIDSQTTRWQVAKAAQEAILDARGSVVGAILNKRRRVIPEFIYRML